jgi:hypothetical protein
MWTDMLYLTSCTVLLKAVACVPGSVSYVLGIEKAQLCFSHDHMPIFLTSILLYATLLLYPLAIYKFMTRSIKETVETGGKPEKNVWFAATIFMIQSVQLEWKPLRASYRFLLRNTIAVFGVVPAEYSYVLLIVSLISLADCVFILIKKPYATLIFNLCKPAIAQPILNSILWRCITCFLLIHASLHRASVAGNATKALVLALVIVFSLPAVKSRVFIDSEGADTSEKFWKTYVICHGACRAGPMPQGPLAQVRHTGCSDAGRSDDFAHHSWNYQRGR